MSLPQTQIVIPVRPDGEEGKENQEDEVGGPGFMGYFISLL